MTLTTTVNTKTATGDGSTTAFGFPYLFYDEGDLVVEVDGVTQTITTDYTVIGAGVAAGGTVTFVSAPANNAVIVIQRIVAYDQQTDFENFDGNPADVTEKQFDLIAMQAQQNNERISRGILTPVTTTLTSNEISGTIDTTIRLLTLTTSGPATATVASLSGSLDVTLSGETTGDLLRYNGTDWSNVTQASLGLLTDVVGDTSPQLGGTLDTNSKQVRWSKGADVASANALTLGTDGNYFDITGTTTITSIGTLAVGTVVKLHFDGALTLTHNATDLILPGGANITTAAGDEAEFVEYATGDWRCTSYTKADGGPVVSSAAAGLNFLGSYSASNDTSVDIGSGLDLDAAIDSTYDEYELHIIDLRPATNNTDIYLRSSTDGGSSFDSGASNYNGTVNMVENAAGVTSAVAGGTQLKLNSNSDVKSAAAANYNAIIRLFDPANTATQTVFGADANYSDGAGGFKYTFGGGQRSATADVDALRILMSSGNISAGEFNLYGVKKS